MKLRITIDVFSGRPNPILYLEDAKPTKPRRASGLNAT
jgi:hypothetical protein